MTYAGILDRLAGFGGAKWGVHFATVKLAQTGRDVIDMTIGNPDVPTPDTLVETAVTAMRAGRTQYSNGPGELNLRTVLAARYSARSGRTVSADQILCFPGTQTSLYAVLMGLAEAGSEVLVGDPMYATYEGVVAASGARLVPVPLRPENGFRISAADIAARITPATRVILLNTPHNPTGAVLSTADLDAIGALAIKHDLWLISDEVYEELIFDGVEFHSPFDRPELAERVVVVSSISKSHAAPGFRSGWVVGSEAFCAKLLPLSEVMLFGNQPFIADMTAAALAGPSPTAAGMRARFAGRADRMAAALEAGTNLKVHRPDAGMFLLIDIRATGCGDEDYAMDLLHREGVGVMPGSAFGAALSGWVRVALTIEDDRFHEATQRIMRHANAHTPIGA